MTVVSRQGTSKLNEMFNASGPTESSGAAHFCVFCGFCGHSAKLRNFSERRRFKIAVENGREETQKSQKGFSAVYFMRLPRSKTALASFAFFAAIQRSFGTFCSVDDLKIALKNGREETQRSQRGSVRLVSSGHPAPVPLLRLLRFLRPFSEALEPFAASTI